MTTKNIDITQCITSVKEAFRLAISHCGMLPIDKCEMERYKLRVHESTINNLLIELLKVAENGCIDLDKYEIIVVLRED